MDTTCAMVQCWTRDAEQRAESRRTTSLPARLVWRDAQSATRFASVRISNISESGAFVECLSGTSIPLYRLVQLQAERFADRADLPSTLRQGRVLAAVYRVESGAGRAATPRGYGLRLLAEPSATAARQRRQDRIGTRSAVAARRSIA